MRSFYLSTPVSADYYLKTNLILFEPNPKSEGFLTLLNNILSFDHCYCPTADPDFCEDDRFPEKEFKKMVKDIFIEMKERYPSLTCARDDTSRELKLGSMQIANKLYHAPQFHSSLNPSNFGMRQSDLDKLSKSSILEYMNDEKNTKIPPSYVKAFQKQLQFEIMRTDIYGRYIYSLDDRSLYQSKLALLLHSPILSVGPSIDKRIQLVFQKSGKFWTLNALSEGQYDVGSKAHSFGKHGKKSF